MFAYFKEETMSLSTNNPSRKDLPIPRRLLHRMLASASIKSESKVLDVGSGDGSIVAHLRKSGIDAWGIDEQAPPAGALKEYLKTGGLMGAVPFGPHSFELVLLRGMRVFADRLDTPEACMATANVLSCLQTSGRLLLVDPAEPSTGIQPNAARTESWQQHLSLFPGTFSVRPFAEGISWYLSLKFLFQPKLDAQILEFKLPDHSISRLEWHRKAREAVAKLQQNRAA